MTTWVTPVDVGVEWIRAGSFGNSAFQGTRTVWFGLDDFPQLRAALVQLCRLFFCLRAVFLRFLFGWDGVSKLLYRCPQPLVAWLLRRFGANIAATAILNSPLYVHNATGGYHHLKVGEGAHVGKRVFLDLTQPIIVGERATVSMGVTILTHMDVGRSRLKEGRFPRQEGSVRIGPDAYIGANATILHGVSIGAGAVVAAGAVVRRDVDPSQVVAGVPARSVDMQLK